jgi:toxin FitB
LSERLGYLLDTNVVSETRKKKADERVLSFLESAEASELYISVLTLGELRKGVARKKLEDPEAAARLAGWVEGLEFSFADRIVSIDAAIARLWGDWSGQRPRPVVDTLLAASAVVHGLILVTRNIRDVQDTPVKVLDPWKRL